MVRSHVPQCLNGRFTGCVRGGALAVGAESLRRGPVGLGVRRASTGGRAGGAPAWGVVPPCARRRIAAGSAAPRRRGDPARAATRRPASAASANATARQPPPPPAAQKSVASLCLAVFRGGAPF